MAGQLSKVAILPKFHYSLAAFALLGAGGIQDHKSKVFTVELYSKIFSPLISARIIVNSINVYFMK